MRSAVVAASRAAAQVVAAASAVAACVAEPAGIPLVAAALALVTGLVWWPRSRAWLPWLAGGAGAVSGAATAGSLLWSWLPFPNWTIIELFLLCLLVAAVARWSPVRAAVAGGFAAGLPSAVAILRVGEQMSGTEAVYGVAFWAFGPVLAAAGGGLLRMQHTRRVRAVEEARREQRLELARDLHDYVAHDVSEMIAQAQAAQLAADGPVLGALRHIETAGLRAMAAMDRTVRMLHDDPDEARSQQGVAELPELVERFAAASPARVRLELESGLAERIPRELTSTVHRIVVEALTNVRRHAPRAEWVEVCVREVDRSVEVSVANDASDAPPGELGRSGGLGLPGLTERVEALAGTLRAGPHGNGWRVLARLPVSS
ncbi:sensor histidine kinase [Amycolatopsis suaedae]|uniref:histidine kinase n=1 Tax=Amycolatopsis suaedae TaxID=2510978 RepID=A0A4Q7IWI6_9PSEU|nr:histidine kinase [Amycolatopsis suaedae]RZQ59290.1 two-component sensor histidine kinase [Amycolatopsis suaedae]